ncbi:MAG: hypothetical protein V4612_06935 [Pseudomonadota bacterium]
MTITVTTNFPQVFADYLFEYFGDSPEGLMQAILTALIRKSAEPNPIPSIIYNCIKV